MADSKAYDDLIMDHIRNARNFRALADASHHADGSNPLCGDELAVYVRLINDCIEEVSFQCTCCGISMASASIMTASVHGKSVTEARVAIAEIVTAIAAHDDTAFAATEPAHEALLKTVRQFPARARCALLPWATLEGALDNQQEPVTLA